MRSSYLENILETLAQKKELISIFVPGSWLNHENNSLVKINFHDFLTDRIKEILKSPSAKSKNISAWTNDAVIYNLFPKSLETLEGPCDEVTQPSQEVDAHARVESITVDTANGQETDV